jgi:hypothetical protein
MDWKPENFTKNTSEIFSLIKDGSNIARDLIFLILFVLLLRWPATLSNMLKSAGVTEVNAGIFTWKQQLQDSADQNKAAAQANSAATDSLSTVQAALSSIAEQSKDPAIKAQATQALGQVNGSLSSLQNVDQSLTKSLVTQQTILQTPTATQASSQPGAPAATIVSAQGWVYLGEADANRQRWLIPPQPKVAANSPVPQVGQTITLTDDLYLRADKAAGQTYNQAPITGAVRSGSQVKVLDLQPSHALNGGLFLWAKIQVNP